MFRKSYRGFTVRENRRVKKRKSETQKEAASSDYLTRAKRC
jgi:hypothetical protein